MKKGSKARKCFRCGEIVMWFIPAGVDYFGLPKWDIKILPNNGVYKNKYCCKKCAEELRGGVDNAK